MNRIVLPRYLYLCVVLMLGVCRVSLPAECEIPRETLNAFIGDYFESDVNLAPLSTEMIQLEALPVKACQVTLRTQIPFLLMVFLDTDSGWRLIRENMVPSDDWEEILLDALGESAFGATVLSRPGDVASDLCKLLVNIDERYGVVLQSSCNVPWDYTSSDVFRDLEREGNDREQIRRGLLSGVPLWISPPALIDLDGRMEIQFFTWSYFEGDVIAWKYSPDHPQMSLQIVASQVGSYDYYR